MLCPECSTEIQPILSKDMVRYSGKLMKVLENGELIEAEPEYLCRGCGITWRIKPTGILASARDELVRKFW